jgi:hypothetical protein
MIVAIIIVSIITLSVIFLPPQWDLPKKKEKRNHTNNKYVLPAQFWDDVNFVENMIHTMTDDTAKNVFNYLNQMNDKYRRFFMNRTFDERMTHLIEKYNAKINYFHNNKTK